MWVFFTPLPMLALHMVDPRGERGVGYSPFQTTEGFFQESYGDCLVLLFRLVKSVIMIGTEKEQNKRRKIARTERV